MEIKDCLLTDADEILTLYDAASELQRKHKVVEWPKFYKPFIEAEINELRQFKIVHNAVIACNWAVTYEDKEIWGDKDKNDSIFIHRICTNPNLRGNRYIDQIVAWAKVYAKNKGKQFLRLDTLGNNTSLIKHYTSAGFNFLGIFTLTDTANLPGHYQKEPNCCLFEIDLAIADK